MHTNQDVSITFPISLRLPEAILTAARSAIKHIHDSREAARYAAVVSKLAPHLRYDIGEIDQIPSPPPSLREVQHSREQSLETLWLRYF